MSREAVLQQIRAALAAAGPSPASTTPSSYEQRSYQTRPSLNREERLSLFIQRVEDYDARVFHSLPESLAHDIAEILLAAGRNRMAVPYDLPKSWMDPRIEWLADGAPEGAFHGQLPNAELETCDGVLTGASLGIADSGTLVLQHGALEGRRALTLLPDYHLCVLEASQVVETLPEGFARLDASALAMTFISGPSATADIEMTRIKGVHGPRFLDLVLLP